MKRPAKTPVERAYRIAVRWHRQHKTWKFTGSDVVLFLEWELAYQRAQHPEPTRRKRCTS